MLLRREHLGDAMSTGFAMGLIAVLIIPSILMFGLGFAPKAFWRGLAEEHRATAHFLWGFSHMFGPISKPGDPPAWEKMK